MLHSNFFFNDTAPTEIYTLSLHDALPIYHSIENENNNEVGHEYEIDPRGHTVRSGRKRIQHQPGDKFGHVYSFFAVNFLEGDRKSTRLNSSHRCISYAVFCLKKKNMLMLS